MSAERQVVVYTPPGEIESGESRWIRIEQVEPLDEAVTLDEAAAIIDGLFGVDPCEQGMGGGGEAADEDEPTEEEISEAAANTLRGMGLCTEDEYWDAVVNVFRSHPTPEYVLRSESAEVLRTTAVRESRRQEVEVNGAIIELDRPYAGNLRGVPVGVRWTVRGSTVNLDRPLRARLVLRYDTRYDRVILRVPTGKRRPGGIGGGDPMAASGSGGQGMVLVAASPAFRKALDQAAVVAFWGDLAAGCELSPPDQDSSVNESDIKEACGKKSEDDGPEHDWTETDCWKTILHFSRCNCSHERTNEYSVQLPVSCDGATSGSHIGFEEQFDGFLICPGEEDEVNDPEYYREKCCKQPPLNLPRCRKNYGIYNGGAEIESGPEHWKSIYGEDVAMVAVLPKEGRCGEHVTEWLTPSRNCCDDVTPMEPWDRNPTTITTPGAATLCVTGGKGPYRWTTGGGYKFVGSEGRNFIVTAGQCATVYTDDVDVCNATSVMVDDGCSKLSMPLRREEPGKPLTVEPEEVTVAPDSEFVVHAGGGQGKIQWTAGGVTLLTPQGERGAHFRTPKDFCGQATVTATDSCGDIAQMVVLSTHGRWARVEDFDPCTSPPGWGIPCIAANVGYSNARVSHSERGYRATLRQAAGYLIYQGVGDCGDFAGDCGGAVSESSVASPCGYDGNEMMLTVNCTSLPVQPSGSNVEIISPLCHREKSCTYQGQGQYAYDKRTYAASQFVEELWRWECP